MILTNELINKNKEHYLTFFDNEIQSAVWHHLELMDLPYEETIYSTDIELHINNLTFEIELFGISLEEKNKYTFDGELIGRAIKERDHTYNFNTLRVAKVWCDEVEEFIKLDIVEELNNKYLILWKL